MRTQRERNGVLALMIRYAASVAVTKPEPTQARGLPVARSVKGMVLDEPTVVVTLAAAEPAAGLLLLISEPEEPKAVILPNTTKPRRVITKRKAKVAVPDSAPLQLNLDA
jgi:hypothetical protein